MIKKHFAELLNVLGNISADVLETLSDRVADAFYRAADAVNGSPYKRPDLEVERLIQPLPFKPPRRMVVGVGVTEVPAAVDGVPGTARYFVPGFHRPLSPHKLLLNVLSATGDGPNLNRPNPADALAVTVLRVGNVRIVDAHSVPAVAFSRDASGADFVWPEIEVGNEFEIVYQNHGTSTLTVSGCLFGTDPLSRMVTSETGQLAGAAVDRG